MGKIFSVKDNGKNVEDASNRVNKNEGGSHVSNSNKGSIKADKKETVLIDLSPRLILFILLLLAVIYFGSQLLNVVLFLFFGFVIMSTVKPIARWLKDRGLSKALSIFIAYFLLIITILALLVLVFVPFINQLTGLIEALPNWIDESLHFLEDFSVAGYSLGTDTISEYITDFIKRFPTAANVKSVATFVTDFVGMGAFFVTSIIFSIYLLSEHDTFADLLLIKIVSDEKRERVRKLVMDVENKLGSWVLGQGAVSFTTSVFSFILLTILGVPFALPLAMFSGLMNLIPNLGSTLAGFVMALVALISVGPIKALIVLIAFIIYQPIENGIIVPKVMGNAVGLKPVVVLLGVMVFLTFFGLLGSFVAVPLMVVAQIFYEFYVDLQKLKAKGIV
jgi:predicted PurR-regulated permease PerM